tara:strand:+ start:5210 stop:5734 length:525 start_codon:yes stop_codon:yes gene_type:complete
MSKASDIPKIPGSLWQKAGEKAKGLILTDASKGQFQSKRTTKYKYSGSNDTADPHTYFARKKRDMRKLGRGLNKVGQGDRYKGLEGKSLSKEVGFVNMRLTGKTQRRIKAESIKNGFKLIFARGEIVEGNAKRGYILNDLRDKNYKVIEDMVGQQLDKNINKYTSKPETFRIGG